MIPTTNIKTAAIVITKAIVNAMIEVRLYFLHNQRMPNSPRSVPKIPIAEYHAA